MPAIASLSVRPIYLFYGTQHEAVMKARDEAVAMLLPPESRDENLTNYYQTGNQKFSLGGVMDEIAGDFATMSFLPDAKKIAIVTNPEEIFGGAEAEAGEAEPAPKPGRKGGSGGASAALLNWLEHDLPQTGNHLIILGLEDESAHRTVPDKKPNAILKLILKFGFTRAYSDKKAIFKLEDTLLSRDLNGLLETIRGLWSSQTNQMILNKMAQCIRFCLQANIARERRLAPGEAAASALFPSQPQANLFKAHEFVQKKYAAPLYRTADLIKAHQQLLGVYRALRPRPGDVYVPDAQGMLEITLLELLRSPRPRK